MTEVELSLWDFILRISDDLISMWQVVNSRLPLISIQAIRYPQKSKRLIIFFYYFFIILFYIIFLYYFLEEGY